MNIEDFRTDFKEQLNILFEAAASKADRTCDLYFSGKMDGIESVENLFDRLWKEYEKQENNQTIVPDQTQRITFK